MGIGNVSSCQLCQCSHRPCVRCAAAATAAACVRCAAAVAAAAACVGCAAAVAAAAGPAQGSSRDIVNAILLILVNVALSDEIGFCY